MPIWGEHCVLARLVNDERVASLLRRLGTVSGTALELRDVAGRLVAAAGEVPAGRVPDAVHHLKLGLVVEGEVRAFVTSAGANAVETAQLVAEFVSAWVHQVTNPGEAPVALAHERLAAALDSSTDAIWDWDLTTDTTYYSARWYEMLGYAPGALGATLETWSSLTDPDDARATMAKVQRAVETGEPYASEFRMRHADGSQRWILARGRVSARDASGKATRISGVNTDITERKQQEAERERLASALRQSEKLSAIGQLAGGIAHDFNNQLTAIIGAAESLATTVSTEDDRELVADILTASTRSADLTRKLLAFSRRGQVREAPVDVHGVVSEVMAVLKRSVDRRIALRVDLEAARCIVKGDSSALQNALLNLALNARDAMPSGGTLTLRSRTVRVTEEDRFAFPNLSPGNYLQVQVSDTGTGMTREVQDRLFEPFFTTKPAGSGTGMGLASVYGTVTAHHGTVQVETAPGRGSTFRVFLPLGEAGLIPRAPAVRVLPPVAPCRVLVVDDEPLVRERFERTLTAMGHRVESARGGWEAIDRFSATREGFDVVFLDVMMPDLNGRDVLVALRQLSKRVRVVVTSGFAQEGDVQAMLEQGARVFLQKPFLKAALVQALAEAMAPGEATRPGPELEAR
jgi:PAS domain S-box-containing protein